MNHFSYLNQQKPAATEQYYKKLKRGVMSVKSMSKVFTTETLDIDITEKEQKPEKYKKIKGVRKTQSGTDR